MIWFSRKHTAARGRTVVLEMDEAAFSALEAAVRIAFEDETSVPDEYAGAVDEWWELFASDAVA